ncbi:hypothetical protein [Nonomuraea dietziae]|uniref:hypothetical protein n=1 Tax=Nonomuraea dietziae TaxID=65515 RepID=UPI00342AB18C
MDELIGANPVFLALLGAEQYFPCGGIEISNIHKDGVLRRYRVRREVWDGHVVLQAAVLVDRLTIYAYFSR